MEDQAHKSQKSLLHDQACPVHHPLQLHASSIAAVTPGRLLSLLMLLQHCRAKAAQQDAQLQEAQQQAQLQPQQQATAREEVQQARLQEVQLQEAQQALLSQLSQQQAREEVQQAQQQEPQQQQQDAQQQQEQEAQQQQEQDEVSRRIAKAHRGYANSAHKNSARSCANKVVKFAGLSEEKFRKMQKFSRRPGAAHYVREAQIANTAAQAQVQLAKGILRQIEKYKKQEDGGPLAAATAAKAAWEVVKSSHQHVCDLLLSVKELPATLPQ